MKRYLLLAALLLAANTPAQALKMMNPGEVGYFGLHKKLHKERIALLEKIRESLASINVSATSLAEALERKDGTSADTKEVAPAAPAEEAVTEDKE